jgi:hypothetical protein
MVRAVLIRLAFLAAILAVIFLALIAISAPNPF